MAVAINADFVIPDAELELSFARSSGPGGQNVNKVNSKVILRWNAFASSAVPWPVRDRLLARLAPRLTNEGELVIASDRFRDQGRNREDCLEKLRETLLAALFVPKTRKKTKPTRGSVKRKLEGKKRQGEKKALRRKLDY